MLKLDDFLKLPDDEKGERYAEMSDHDKFLWRVGYEPLKGETVGSFEMSEEDKAEIETKYAKYINEFHEDVKKLKRR